MTEANVRWTDGIQFVGLASSGHAVVIDADHKRNTGPGPMELILLGLGACTSTDVVGILQKKREKVTSLEVTVRGERAATPPAVYTKIHVHFIVTGKQIKEKSVRDAIHLSETKYCSVSAMLEKTAHLTFDYEIREAG